MLFETILFQLALANVNDGTPMIFWRITTEKKNCIVHEPIFVSSRSMLLDKMNGAWYLAFKAEFDFFQDL